MSYQRKKNDVKKMNNYAAKHDFNKGGFHGKSSKAIRHEDKIQLTKLNDLNEFEESAHYEDGIGY